MIEDKAHEMVHSFERSIRAQGVEPEQYYQLAGASHADLEQRVRPDAEDTVKKELVLDAVAAAEGIVADEDEVMREIGHLAEDSDRSPEELAETMRQNGTYALLEEEVSRQRALDLLVENAVPVPTPEEAEEDEPVEAGGGSAAGTEKSEREEKG